MTNRLILSPILMRPTLMQLQVAGNEQLRQARCPGWTGGPGYRSVALWAWLGCAMAAHENLAGGLIGVAARSSLRGWPAAWCGSRYRTSADEIRRQNAPHEAISRRLPLRTSRLLRAKP